MPSSSSCGLAFMWIAALLFILAQGQQPPGRGHRRYSPVKPNCCPTASKGRFKEPIVACFEQKPHKFPHCRIHAYILETDTKKYCMDPNGRWLKKTLKELKERGIYCKEL